MEHNGIWIVILLVWVWVLQSRVKTLEETVGRLINTVRALQPEEAHASAHQEEVSETSVSTPPEAVPMAKGEGSAVEAFKQAHKEPSAPQIQSPQEPSAIVTWFADYFTGGNLLVRIGGVVLFFGLAFLVKYAAEHSLVSIAMRLWGVATLGVAITVIGWRLRSKEGAYGLVLQGIGVAILYLVIYGASKYYGLLSLQVAFGLMFAVVVSASILAIVQDALPLALFASAGGFMVPILTSTGQGSHIVLFSYYAFLNLGIFIVAWYRSWRSLNLLGFLFTFVIATVWGVLRYRPELFATTEPFLLLFFTMYLSISILFTLKHPYRPQNLIDATLVFGLPTVAFPLQVALVRPYMYGEAYSAVALGALYGGLFWILRHRSRTNLLADSFLALSVIFFTVAIPYIFDADVTAALWSLEAAGVIWISFRQKRPFARYFGMAILFVATVLYPESVRYDGITLAEYGGFLIIITSLMTTAYLFERYRKELNPAVYGFAYLFLLLALVLWFGATPTQLEYFGKDALMITLLIGMLIVFTVAKALKWKLLAVSLQGAIPLGMLLFYASIGVSWHPFSGYGFWTFALFTGAAYGMLRVYDKVWYWTKPLHLLLFWFSVSVLTFEAHYIGVRYGKGEDIQMLSWGVVPLLGAAGVLYGARFFGRYKALYLDWGTGVLLGFLALWQIAAFGVTYGTEALPLFNPLDLMQLSALGLTVYWIGLQQRYRDKGTTSLLYVVAIFLGWALLTILFARYVHHTRWIPYTPTALWENGFFQTGISILWSLLAIGAMLLSKRYAQRTPWIAGFGLLIVVVFKLFVVELSHSGTIERIVSFIVVGLLLLLIGYFVPMPPKQKEHKIDSNKKVQFYD